MKKLSIITINLNNLEGLRKTASSVLGQSFSNYEFIIIDGYSNDGSVEYISSIDSKVLTHWISEKDSGIYDAMNKGINKSSGEYLLFLNSGDCLFSESVIHNITSEINISKFDIYYADVSCFLNDVFIQKITYPDQLDIEFWLNNTLNHQSIIIKRELFDYNNLYSLRYKIASDFEFILKAFMCGAKFNKLPFLVSNYDLNGFSSFNTDLLLREREEIISNLISPYFLFMVKKNKEYEQLKKFRVLKIAIKLNNAYLYFKKKFLKLKYLFSYALH